ncbi:IS200/IS605 family transposase [Bacillus sp. Marseille-P3800]|uniref:IS200/IS605 family transposase n=1 Tax=Bacillus sp. Marseille-P3800 TaxID=2014782 RepID=UPI000C06E80C|nr:IS200/IS605 family transposase [Bacillus sp. Marseille-P3800]
MTKVHHGRGYVYSIQYHFVWCVKYRHDILIGKVDDDLKTFLHRISDESGVNIIEMETGRDHIHMLVDCKPQHTITNLIKSFKGTSARYLFRQHPDLKDKLWNGHLWNPSYFVATVSDNSEQQIREYIQSQKKK